MSDDRTQKFLLEEIRELRKDFKEMNETLAVNTESLRTHIRRTELLEQMTTKLDGRLTDLEIKRIEKNAVKRWLIDKIIMLGKIAAAITTIGGTIMGMPIVIDWIKKLIM